MPIYSWSKTAATNSTADSTINYQEGQAPSTLNDSGRAEMAALKKWVDDVSGTVTTGGSSTAYTITTNSVFDTAAHMSGALICFIPHTTSGAAPTLAVDGLTARAINKATGVAVATGALISGTPYMVTYIHASTEFILVGQVAFPTSFGATTFTGLLTVSAGGAAITGDTAVTGTVSGSTGFKVGSNPTATVGKTPTYQVFTSGTSQTYTTPAGVTWIRVREWGGGGGGGGTGTAAGANGGTGGTTTFNSVTAIGGSGGVKTTNTAGGAGGAGGTGGSGTGTVLRIDGSAGTAGGPGTTAVSGTSNPGVGSPGAGAYGGPGMFGGAGGTGTSSGVTAIAGGGGGGTGEYVEAIFAPTAAQQFTYTVGAAGTAGTAGTSGNAGLAGSAGKIIVEEYYN